MAAGLVSAPSYAADFEIADRDYAAPHAAYPEAKPFEGFYLGGHAGYGQANRNGCFDEGFPAVCDGDVDFDYNQNGWLAGGQIGYNHFIDDSGLMLGVEVSASLTGITGNLVFDDYDGFADGVGDWTYLATATGKIGFAMNNILLYGEAGLGLGGYRYNSAICNFESNDQGWVAGAGLETTVSPNNTLFVEYNHLDFKDKDASCGALFIPISVHTKSTIDVVKLGFNHSFN